jgi:hypothetical protein
MKLLCGDFAGLSLGGTLTVPFGHLGTRLDSDTRNGRMSFNQCDPPS